MPYLGGVTIERCRSLGAAPRPQVAPTQVRANELPSLSIVLVETGSGSVVVRVRLARCDWRNLTSTEEVGRPPRRSRWRRDASHTQAPPHSGASDAPRSVPVARRNRKRGKKHRERRDVCFAMCESLTRFGLKFLTLFIYWFRWVCGGFRKIRQIYRIALKKNILLNHQK